MSAGFIVLSCALARLHVCRGCSRLTLPWLAEAHLPQQALWAAECLRRMLAVAHLHTGQGDSSACLCSSLHDVRIGVVLASIEVAAGELGCMRPVLEPPVYACQLEA